VTFDPLIRFKLSATPDEAGVRGSSPSLPTRADPNVLGTVDICRFRYGRTQLLSTARAFAISLEDDGQIVVDHHIAHIDVYASLPEA